MVQISYRLALKVLAVYVSTPTSMMAGRPVGVNQEIADTVVVMALRVVPPLRRRVNSLGRICFDPRRHQLDCGQPCVADHSLRARSFAQCHEIEKRLQWTSAPSERYGDGVP